MGRVWNRGAIAFPLILAVLLIFALDWSRSIREEMKARETSTIGISAVGEEFNEFASVGPVVDKELDRHMSKTNKLLNGEVTYLYDLFPHIKYPPFQPFLTEDFPTTSGKPRIPHIFHQTFTSKMLPERYAYFAKKLSEMNPSWSYYFWTDDSARTLIKDQYPELLKAWDSYKHSINRGDFLRYVVLHAFGGAYIDLDVDSLRPLDRVTKKYACIIPTEPFEHNIFIYKTQIFLTNAIMFCRPKHPFFQLMLDNIKETFRTRLEDYERQTVAATGPGFVSGIFIKYNNIDVKDENRTKIDFSSNSPYFYRGVLPETHEDAVYVPNTQYFTDDLDLKFRRMEFQGICKAFSVQTFLTKRACIDMERRGMERKYKLYKFLVHTWRHMWLNSSNYEIKYNISIHNVVPKCMIYRENML